MFETGGATVGVNTFFYAPTQRPVDETSLPFIEIGDNCRITKGVVILGHDYSYATLRPVYHCMLRKCTVTTIGNNVFIGMNSIILPGAIVGDNVVVGAGSVVSGKYPSNVVIAGNPAQVICSLDEYYEKNFQRFEEYAKIYYRQKSKFLGRKLTDREMGWYTALYKCADKEEIISNMRVDGDEKEEVIQDVMKIEPKYNSLEELLGELY